MSCVSLTKFADADALASLRGKCCMCKASYKWQLLGKSDTFQLFP